VVRRSSTVVLVKVVILVETGSIVFRDWV
jgi:hypothetical protein